MAKLADQVRVKVSDRGADGGKRKITVEVEASEDFFYLTDALSREGAVSSISSELRSVIRSGVLNYVQQSRELLRKVGEKEKA